MFKNKSERIDEQFQDSEAFGKTGTSSIKRGRLLYVGGVMALIVFVGFGIFAKNGWLPHTDPLTGKKSGWFGQDLSKNAGSTWNPFAAPSPTPTPQLSKEYIYAGSRLLAVEDANANAAPPSDIGVWRPSTGVWYILSSQLQVTIVSWGGQPGDKTVPGDFDGDGKTDFSIYRPSDGNWYILRSSDGGVSITNWGLTGDVPTAADFDGDGKTDAAIYRASSGLWCVLKSSDGQVMLVTWGSTGDAPAPADYDGDGKADVAVFRASNNTFYALRTSDGQVQQGSFSGSGDKPVPADYDGDGKADFAIKSGNNWTIAQSSTNTIIPISWPYTSSWPVQNDYDGDGKVDIAVWDESTGIWYIRQSAHLSVNNGLRTESWGTTGDIPVPAFYRR